MNDNLEYIELNKKITGLRLMIVDVMSFDPAARQLMIEKLDELEEIYKEAVIATHE